MNENQLYRFLNACEGNWRNTILITCKNCPYKEQLCPGYFLTTDRNGCPVLYPVDKLQKCSKELIDVEDCIGSISRQAFEALYSRWLIWRVSSPHQCNILQVLRSEQQTDTAI
ncbi:MAG: hypothetical protein HFE65_05600 [Clostridiales bacterium]|nr:hypothetical protein [Clostridiales bacterium]